MFPASDNFINSANAVHPDSFILEIVHFPQEIHKKIMQLNFRECFSKIKSVDSQKTINGGVVVQVS